jgi:hypothetical protein
MPSAAEFVGATEQVVPPAPASNPLRPIKALPSHRPRPIVTAEETISTVFPKIQSPGTFQIAPGMQPSAPYAAEGITLDAARAMRILGYLPDDVIEGIIKDVERTIAEGGNQVSDEASWPQSSEGSGSGVPPGGYSQPSWDSSQNYPAQQFYAANEYTGMGYVVPDYSSYVDAYGYSTGQVQGGYYSIPPYSQHGSTGASADDHWLQAQPLIDTPFVESSYSTLSGAVPPLPSFSYPTAADTYPPVSNLSSQTFDSDLSDSMGLRSTSGSHPTLYEQQSDGNQGDEVDEAILATLIDQTDSGKAQEKLGHMSKKKQERILKNRKIGKKPPTKKGWDIQSKRETNPGNDFSVQIPFSGAIPPFASSIPSAIVPSQQLRPSAPSSRLAPQTGNQPGSPFFSYAASSFDVPSPSSFRFATPVASSSRSAIPPPSMNQDWLDPSFRDEPFKYAQPSNFPYDASYSEEALIGAVNQRYLDLTDNVGLLPTSTPESSTRQEPAPTRSEYNPNPHTLRPDPAVVRCDPPPPSSYQPDPAVHPPPSLPSQCTPSFSPASPTPSDSYRSPSSSSSYTPRLTPDPEPTQGPSFGLSYTDQREVRDASDEEQVDYGSD